MDDLSLLFWVFTMNMCVLLRRGAADERGKYKSGNVCCKLETSLSFFVLKLGQD